MIFEKYHYLMNPQQAFRFTRPNIPIGGEYKLPDEWKTLGTKEPSR
jgi:hypothetical protein